MGDFDCLLIGKELINKIRASTIDWGYINGFTHDDVFCAFSADIGEKNSAVCQASLLISQHRFFDNNYKISVRWVFCRGYYLPCLDILYQQDSFFLSHIHMPHPVCQFPSGIYAVLNSQIQEKVFFLNSSKV